METNATSAIVYEAINGTNGRYRWTKYLNICVIEDMTNGYINATKMCSMYGRTKGGKEKQFSHWKQYNQNFINLVSASLAKGPDELVPCAVTGGQNAIIRGTYVHRDLAVHLASWCSDEFGYMVSKIINSHIEAENQKLSEQLTTVTKQNEGLRNTLEQYEDQVVIKTEDTNVNELMVVMHDNDNKYVVLRTQERNKKQMMKNCRRRYGNDFEEAFSVISYQNPRNLFHRFKEHVNGDHELREKIKFHRTTFRASNIDIDEIKSIVLQLEKTFRDRMNVV